VADLFGEARELPELLAFSFKLKTGPTTNGQVIVDPGRE
jgi:hypothetical protein